MFGVQKSFLFAATASFVAIFTTSAPIKAEPHDCEIGTENGKITIRGPAKIEDGDTIWVGIHKIRLYGIEALEEDQPCTRDNKRQDCAERSIQALSEILKGQFLKCYIDIGKRGEPIMSYNRYLAICNLADGTELNRRLVREGWVIADPSPKGKIYRADQKFAEERLLGIHSAVFMSPKEYRRLKSRSTDPCPTGFQCVRSTRTDIEDLLNAFKRSKEN